MGWNGMGWGGVWSGCGCVCVGTVGRSSAGSSDKNTLPEVNETRKRGKVLCVRVQNGRDQDRSGSSTILQRVYIERKRAWEKRATLTAAAAIGST